MADRVIIREIPRTDPRLGRRVEHDSRSRAFAFPTTDLPLVSARHTRRIPVTDQGSLGSCTGHAGIGCMGTDPFYATAVPLLRTPLFDDPDGLQAAYEKAARAKRLMVLPTGPSFNPDRTPYYTLDESGAVHLYSDATRIDEWPGEYPPTDTGSSGLAIAKALKNAGMIAGYQWTYSLDAYLRALGVTPVITGTVWTEDMFRPDADGRVHPTGAVAGGHEYCTVGVDVERRRIWHYQSWGQWGLDGTGLFYTTFDDHGYLLDQQGDAVVFVPITQPAPTPPPDPDTLLAEVLKPWCAKRRCSSENKALKAAGLDWLAKKGL